MFAQTDGGLEWRGGHDSVRLEPWGRDSLRVRGSIWSHIRDDLPSALLPVEPVVATVEVDEDSARLTNGAITGEISSAGRVRFLRTADGAELLAEATPHFTGPPSRRYRSIGPGAHHFEMLFEPNEGERFYGLGQHQHGRLDQKGAVIELVQRNTEVSVPLVISNRGYAFLWNHPGIGRVELGTTGTRWVAEALRQWDYWISAADEPAQLLRNYGEVAGRAPAFPEWAAGFWQCKLRYRTQDELMEVAREYRRRGLPLSVIVVDYFHWTMQGEWRFDPAEWPDPGGMVAELESMGVKLMVSIWPTVNTAADSWEEMTERGLLVASERGIPVHLGIWDKGSGQQRALVSYYDPTNPQARSYLWARAKEGYYKHGIKVWWLDACEPELRPEQHDNLRFDAGPGLEVANLYPRLHAKTFFDGMRAEGEDEVILLCRSAWAGSQRYGAAVWSGDIDSTFEALRAQIPAGLNIGLSGIPWWTTDIGGFKDGNVDDPSFRELLVRWFQFGVFCPILRLHGVREPGSMVGAGQTGADNEVWSFGDEVYRILRHLLLLREHLRPYVMAQMHVARETGLPPMRPLFLGFPADALCWDVDDQFLFGPDALVAPVLEEGARQRRVYLPAGADWRDAWTGERYPGGTWLDSPAPLETVPVYLRDGGDLEPFGPLESIGGDPG